MTDAPNLSNGPHDPCDPACGCGCHRDDAATHRPVLGYCPMGCGQTLGIPVWPRTADLTPVRCYDLRCPDPRAAEKLLRTEETEHVVDLSATSFHIQHPLRERLDGSLFDCDLHKHITEYGTGASDPGRYRVSPVPGDGTGWTGWAWVLAIPAERAD